eukprot:1421909-Amphidinium_carterae.2
MLPSLLGARIGLGCVGGRYVILCVAKACKEPHFRFSKICCPVEKALETHVSAEEAQKGCASFRNGALRRQS